MRLDATLYWPLLAAVAIGGLIVPQRRRVAWLAAGGLVFCAALSVSYAAILGGLVVVNAWALQWIARRDRRVRAAAGVLALDAVAFVVLKALASASASPEPTLGVSLPPWLLPVGLSVCMFHIVGAVLDVAGKREPPRSVSESVLAVTFFPLMLVGPMIRARDLLTQVEGWRRPSAEAVAVGMHLIVTGLFLKAVVADGLGEPLRALFALDPASVGTGDAWLMGTAATLQVYLTLCGYARVAVGSARLLGIQLEPDFCYPLSAASLPDFWHRYHRSLTAWVNDYVKAPLAGPGGAGPFAAVLAAMVTFAAWYGVTANVLAWGIYHGVLLGGCAIVSGRLRAGSGRTSAGWDAAGAVLSRLATLAAVALGGLLLRSASLPDGLALVGAALAPWSSPTSRPLDLFTLETTALALLAVAAGMVVPRGEAWVQRLTATRPRLYAASAGRGLVYGTLFVWVLVYWGRAPW